jgi:uncharacterized protein YciI
MSPSHRHSMGEILTNRVAFIPACEFGRPLLHAARRATLPAVADYYLVERVNGPERDGSLPTREQAGWDEHARFMDRLAEEGFVVLGGPVGEDAGDGALLVVEAGSEEVVRARLAADPWEDTILTLKSIRPWSIWLRGPRRA